MTHTHTHTHHHTHTHTHAHAHTRPHTKHTHRQHHLTVHTGALPFTVTQKKKREEFLGEATALLFFSLGFLAVVEKDETEEEQPDHHGETAGVVGER